MSFDRPEPFNHIDFDEAITDPIEGRQACHLAPAEWRLLGWLEHRGLPYDFYAETQLDDGTLDLSAYRALILSVHPEYWTRRMYDRIKQWVFQDGGRLLYLGGNGLNCEVEIRDSSMWVHNGRITGLDVAGVGGESRFALRHESEANLLGVVFTPPGAMTGAPYRVLDAEHWIFDRTGLKEGDLFGLKSLHRRCPGGASGHETDKLSPSSPPNARLAREGIEPRRRRRPCRLLRHPARGRRVLGRLDLLGQQPPGGRPRRTDHRERHPPVPGLNLSPSRTSRVMSLSIRNIEARVIDHPVRLDGAILSSLGRHEASHYVTVAITGEDGTRGFGEAATAPVWSGETAETAKWMIDHHLGPILTGSDVRRARRGTRADGSATPRQSLRQGGPRHRALGPHGTFARGLGREPRRRSRARRMGPHPRQHRVLSARGDGPTGRRVLGAGRPHPEVQDGGPGDR